MRIHFLLTQDMESPAGLGRYGPLADFLASQGHEVVISALHPGYDALDQKQVERGNIRIHYAAPMHLRKQGNLKIYYSPLQLVWVTLLATIRLAWRALTTPAEILYIGKPHPMNSIAGLVGKYLKNTAVVLDMDDIEVGIGHFTGGWQKSIVGFFERRMPRFADHITTNTHVQQHLLRAAGCAESKITYIPNGIDPVRFAGVDPEAVEKRRRELGLEGRQVIAYIGTLGLKSHPVDLLLQAFQVLHAKNPHLALLFVGGGEDFDRLKTLAKELDVNAVTVFTGRVPPDQVPLHYALADVTVDPVYDDLAARGRCPLKLFESWAAGVPFVTSAVGDREMLMGAPQAGLLAAPGDAASLAQAIARVLEEPTLTSDLSALGEQRAREYHWQRIGERLLAAFDQARKRRKPI